MLRVNDLLKKPTNEITPEQCFSEIFQEFDSLHGAARAIDCIEIEYFSRVCAQLVKYLEKRLPELPAPEYKTLLEKAIQLGLRCNGESEKCLSHYNKDVIKIQDQVERNCLRTNPRIHR